MKKVSKAVMKTQSAYLHRAESGELDPSEGQHSLFAFSLMTSKSVKKNVTRVEKRSSTEVPFSELELEPRSFAKGAFGEVFKGFYRKTTPIAAKSVFSHALQGSLEGDHPTPVINTITSARTHYTLESDYTSLLFDRLKLPILTAESTPFYFTE